MNKHIVLTYNCESTMPDILQVEYKGTIEQLYEAIDNHVVRDEYYYQIIDTCDDCCYSIAEKLSDLGIKYKRIKYIAEDEFGMTLEE